MSHGLDQDALFAASDLVGRTGAKEFELGHNGDDEDPRPGDTWQAHAQYRGGRVHVEGYPDPVAAAEALARRLLDGAACMGCGKTITLAAPSDATFCRWTRRGPKWVKGCPDDAGKPARVGLAQELRRIPGVPQDLISAAGTGYYDTGPLATPIIQLVTDLAELAARPATPRDSRVKLRDLIIRVKNGDFDATAAERDAWAATAEGQAAAAMIKTLLHGDAGD